MVVKLEEDLFNEESVRNVTDLLSILTRKNRYVVICEYQTIRQTEVYLNLIEEHRKILEDNFVSGIQASQEDISEFIISAKKSKGDKIFDIDEGIFYFQQQVLIILENSNNDGYFIDAIIKNFDNEIIKANKQNNWIKYENAGGFNNIENVIKRHVKEIPKNFPKKKHKYLRCIVIVDSDKKYPQDKLSRTRLSLMNFLDENEIMCHILEKREMENYIPDEAIEDISQNNNYLLDYLGLSNIQKDYFDIEKGLIDKDQEKQLYNNLSQKQKDNLSSGFTHEIIKRKYKREFPKLFAGPKVTKKSLLKRIEHQQDSDELNTSVSKIQSLL